MPLYYTTAPQDRDLPDTVTVEQVGITTDGTPVRLVRAADDEQRWHYVPAYRVYDERTWATVRAEILSSQQVLRYFTTAPVSYDGFGTRTIKADVGHDRKGNTVRLVEIPEAAQHGEWQILRYHSGLHLACSESECHTISDLVLRKPRSKGNDNDNH